MFVVKLRYLDKDTEGKKSFVDKVLSCSTYNIRRFDSNDVFQLSIDNIDYIIGEDGYDQFFVSNETGKTIDSGYHIKYTTTPDN